MIIYRGKRGIGCFLLLLVAFILLLVATVHVAHADGERFSPEPLPCYADSPGVCGDAFCSTSEYNPADCGVGFIGDGICQPWESHPADCGTQKARSITPNRPTRWGWAK